MDRYFTNNVNDILFNYINDFCQTYLVNIFIYNKKIYEYIRGAPVLDFKRCKRFLHIGQIFDTSAQLPVDLKTWSLSLIFAALIKHAFLR